MLRQLLLLAIMLLLSSCLKETPLPISSSFSVEVSEDKTSPVMVKLQNNSYGADVSRASDMFRELGQFKAYLREIDSFDQLYIIQQGGRGVTHEQIIAQLERAIAKDAESVFLTNRDIWINVGIGTFIDLERICRAQGLSKSPRFQIFRNIVQLTN